MTAAPIDTLKKVAAYLKAMENRTTLEEVRMDARLALKLIEKDGHRV